MKLKMYREHYRSKDSGLTWVPKESFDTEEEAIIGAQFIPNDWHIYTCGLCSKYHIGRVKTKRITSNVS